MKVFNISVKVISALLSIILIVFAVWSLTEILNPAPSTPETYEGHQSGYSLIVPIYFAYYAVSLLVMAIVLSVKKSNLIKSIIFTIINSIPFIILSIPFIIYGFDLFIVFVYFWMWFALSIILSLVIFISSLFFKKSAKNTLSTNE